MQVKLLNKRIDYDGSQLSSHFIYNNCGILGDAAVSFRGACDVYDDFMVDLEDLKNKKSIRSLDMLHFICEFYDLSLKHAVTLQRLFICVIKEEIEKLTSKKVERAGDDLFIGKKKLSISIATSSLVSSLIHIGINISSKATPVPTVSLNDLKIDWQKFAKGVLIKMKKEYDGILKALYKVKPVN